MDGYGSGVREDGSDSSPTLYLSVYKLQSVDGSQLSMNAAWECNSAHSVRSVPRDGRGA
jgi:hypothetical protein